jgi:hypothetical protein
MISICDRKTSAHIMTLWKYKPLDQIFQTSLFDPEEVLSIKGGNVAGRQGGGREIMRDNECNSETKNRI